MLQPKSTRPSDTQTAAGHGARNAYVGASATAFSTYLKCGHGSACFVARWPVVVMGAEVMSMVFLVTFQLHWNKMKHAFTAFGNVFKRGVCSDRSQPRCPSPMMRGGEVTRDCAASWHSISLQSRLATVVRSCRQKWRWKEYDDS